jgi:hypothetical protein
VGGEGDGKKDYKTGLFSLTTGKNCDIVTQHENA